MMRYYTADYIYNYLQQEKIFLVLSSGYRLDLINLEFQTILSDYGDKVKRQVRGRINHRLGL